MPCQPNMGPGIVLAYAMQSSRLLGSDTRLAHMVHEPVSPEDVHIHEEATMAKRKHLSDEARDRHPGAGEQLGEGVGGIGGTVAGAGLGSIAGPVGTIIGGLAGAVGGWWAGEKAGRAVEDMGTEEEHYRSHHRELGRTDIPYDEARIGYGVGHAAGHNPDYRDRPFEEVERDLRSGWRYDERDYDTMRPYVRTGYERSSTQRGD